MGLKGRIGKGIAVAAAAAIPATLVAAAPVHAADHFTVDTDSVVVGANSTNNYKAFDGSIESWHDGSHLRATLKGTYVGRGYLKVQWHYAGGGHSDWKNVVYSDGVQKDVPGYTSPSTEDVVRFTFMYDANNGTTDSLERYVGDAPESDGSCIRLDEDTYDVSANGVSFQGTTTYRCDTDGRIYAHIHGTLAGPSEGTWGTASLNSAPSWADGTANLPKSVASVSSSGSRSVTVDVDTPANTPDLRSVTLTVSHGSESSQTKKFGDA